MIDHVITCPCCNHTFTLNVSRPSPLREDETNVDLIKKISNTFNIELAEGGDKKNNGYN